MTEEKNLKSLIRFYNANKIDNYNRGGLKGKTKRKKSKRIYRSSQNIRIVNVILESLLSESFPLLGSHSPSYLPGMPSNTMLISGHAMGLARTLIRSYFSVFLPPMSTGVRASALSFVGLSVTFYIFQSQICLVDPVGSTFHLHSWWEGLALLP